MDLIEGGGVVINPLTLQYIVQSDVKVYECHSMCLHCCEDESSRFLWITSHLL